MQTRRIVVLVTCVLVSGCGKDGSDPSPSPSTGDPSTTVLAPTSTVARVPTLTAEPLSGVRTADLHAGLVKVGFTTAAPTTAPGFVTTTSKRNDATVSTYGKGADDVVKVIAEADKAAAATVLPAVAVATLKGTDGKRSEAWIKAELKKGPRSPTQPRSSTETFGQPHELLITSSTATLSIGRLSSN